MELVHSAPGRAREASAKEARAPSRSAARDDRVELSLPTGVRIFLPRGFDVDRVSSLVAAIERR